MNRKPKIAVIGAGWAGLAAAEQLCRTAELTIFEAGRQAGGRARTLAAASDFAAPDNGQHILIGAYTQVLALLERCGVREADAFLRLPMQWHLADGLRFSAAKLPAPLHLLAGILTAKGMERSEKTALIRQMRSLRRQNPDPNLSVAAWLRRQDATRRLVQMFWQPLVWGAMNTDLEQASLRRLQAVLCDGVWQSRAHSDFLLPRRDLGRLFAGPLCRRLEQAGADIRMGERAGRIAIEPSGSLSIGGSRFDRVLIAAASYHVAALLPEQAPAGIAAAFASLHYHAITTVYLRYPVPVCLPAPMTGLAEGTAQWFVDRHALGLGQHEVAAVISLSERYGRLSREEWAQRVHRDLCRICPHLPEPEAALAVTEQRATAASRTGLPEIPQAWLRGSGIYLAGDYLHPRYPATLEAAVQSGRSAAALIMADCARGGRAG